MNKSGEVRGHFSEGGIMVDHSIYPTDATSVWVREEYAADPAVARLLREHDFRTMPRSLDTFDTEYVRPFARWAWRRYVKPFPWAAVKWLYRHRLLNLRKTYQTSNWPRYTDLRPWPFGKRMFD